MEHGFPPLFYFPLQKHKLHRREGNENEGGCSIQVGENFAKLKLHLGLSTSLLKEQWPTFMWDGYVGTKKSLQVF